MSRNPTIAQIVPNLESGGAERTVLEISESLVAVGSRAITISATGGRLVPALKSLGGEFISQPVATKNPFLHSIECLSPCPPHQIGKNRSRSCPLPGSGLERLHRDKTDEHALSDNLSQ